MNKKLLTLAVAAAMAAPGFASAEAIMYGKLNVSIDYQSIDNVIQPIYNNTANAIWYNPGTRTPVAANTPGAIRVAPGEYLQGEDFKGWGIARNRGLMVGAGRASRLGVKGSEDLGNGLKAVYQIELEINPQDTANNVASGADAITYRNTFVGLAGDWGTLLMGRHDTPLKISTGKLDLFADTMADYNGTVGFDDIRADNVVAYISPSWSGFQLAAATVAGGGSTAIGSTNINSDSISEAYSLAAIYKNGPFYGSIAYESLSNELNMNTATSNGYCFVPPTPATGFVTATCNQTDDDYTKWRVGLGLLDWNGFTLTGIYEQQDHLYGSNSYAAAIGQNSYYLTGGPEKRSLWQIQAGYSFGNFMLKGMYGQTDFEGDFNLPASWNNFTAGAVYGQTANDFYEASTSTWAVGVDYNFSKRTMAYALYTVVDSDQNDIPAFATNVITGWSPTASAPAWDGFSIGMMHSF